MNIDLNDLRRRIIAGEQPTREELHEAIQAIRNNRTTVAEAATRKRMTVKKSDSEVMNDLDAALAEIKLGD